MRLWQPLCGDQSLGSPIFWPLGKQNSQHCTVGENCRSFFKSWITAWVLKLLTFLITTQNHSDPYWSARFEHIWESWRSLGMTTLHSLVAMLTKKPISQKAKRKRPLESCFIYAKYAWPQLTNHNHSECQFRSFSTLTKDPDLEPMKQKKADVMGLRKSPRGVKPHPHTPNYPSPLLCPKSRPLSTL